MPLLKDGSTTLDLEHDRSANTQTTPNREIDPTVFFVGADARHVPGKQGQLCRQVLRAVDDALAECGDPVLHALMVRSVKPAGGLKRLLVTLEAFWADEDSEFDIEHARDRIRVLRGFLRREVAAAINRRKAPELMFYIMEPGEVEL